MKPICLVDEDTRELHQELFGEAFLGLVGSKPHEVFYRKYSEVNSRAVNSFGDAEPFHCDPVPLDLLFDPVMVRESLSEWGVDERQVDNQGEIVACVLTTTADSLGITNRDWMLVDRVPYEVVATHRPEGIGHESLVTVVVLQETTQGESDEEV